MDKFFRKLELVWYDPDNEDTYPSVCQHPEEVESRFGFTGGELLVFDARGGYVGVVVKEDRAPR